MEVIVCRGPNPAVLPACSFEDLSLHWGEDIAEPILNTELAAKERGRVEIDREYTNRKIITITRGSLSFIQPTSIGSLLMSDNGQPINGMVKKINLEVQKSLDSFTAKTTIKLEFIV